LKTYGEEKHKKSEKNDGRKAPEEPHRGDKKTPPRYVNDNGKPIE
jgi:hypothetical protein